MVNFLILPDVRVTVASRRLIYTAFDIIIIINFVLKLYSRDSVGTIHSRLSTPADNELGHGKITCTCIRTYATNVHVHD